MENDGGSFLAAVDTKYGKNVWKADRAKAIDAGNFHTCVLLYSGQMRCWGHNGQWELGGGG